MATRQRARSQRKSSSTAAGISGGQIEGTTAAESNERIDDSQVLRAAFDTTPFEEGEAASTASADTTQVNFVGEQLVYKDRYERIAEAAYLRAEQRGFEPGHEIEDWLAAEKEIDALLASDDRSDGR